MDHKLITTTDLHVPGYLQSGDPGAVGAGKYWIDTTAGAGLWVLKVRNSGDTAWETVGSGGGGGAPTTADYLTGSAQAGLSAEIVVGTTPGGELGGTWASPTIDTTHSGSSHAGVVSTHEGLADPHTGYRLESADHSHATTGLQAGQVAHSALSGIAATDHHAAPAAGPDADDTIDAAGAAGTASTFARSGHGHKVSTSASTPTPAAFGDTGAAGATGAIARSDHRHAMPADPVTAHAAAADPHTGYRLESADHSHASTGLQGGNALDLNAGSLRLPVGTATLTATEGYVGYQSTTERVSVYDGQRERTVGVVGWQHAAFPIFWINTGFVITNALPANGGSWATGIIVTGHMLLESATCRNMDTTLARSWRWDLYEQRLNNGNSGENTLDRVAACNAAESFTAAAASNRTIVASGGPIYLAPGMYWVVIQNVHASNTFGFGSTAPALSGLQPTSQSKTTTNPNGATLNFVTATWVKSSDCMGVWLTGRVFGQTAGF